MDRQIAVFLCLCKIKRKFMCFEIRTHSQTKAKREFSLLLASLSAQWWKGCWAGRMALQGFAWSPWSILAPVLLTPARLNTGRDHSHRPQERKAIQRSLELSMGVVTGQKKGQLL
jgi:hypothetical protein